MPTAPTKERTIKARTSKTKGPTPAKKPSSARRPATSQLNVSLETRQIRELRRVCKARGWTTREFLTPAITAHLARLEQEAAATPPA